MRALLSMFAATAGLLCCILTAQPLSSESASRDTGVGSIYITHVTVIDTETGKEEPDRTVVILGDRISEVGDSKRVKVPPAAKVLDGTGKYLIPGLWDMHVHTWDYESTFPLYVANGVTGVRDMFGPPDANKFRAELAARTVIAPHFYLASPIVDGHPAVWPQSIEVTTADQAKTVVDEQRQKGADFIKVYSRVSREAYFAILAEGARAGIPVEGHVPLLVSAWEASDVKQKSFEHLNGIAMACSAREQELQRKIVPTSTLKERAAITDEAASSYSEAKCNDLLAQLKANGNWQVPTLTVLRSFGLLNEPQFLQDQRLRFFSGEFRDWLTAKDDFRLKSWTADDFALEREQFQFSKKLVGLMFQSGVPLLAGTDTGNPYCFPGFSLHDELALLVESGLTPLAALQAATRNAAIFMNALDRYGAVSKGKIADLVLLDADPLKDIRNTTRIQEVFLAGKEFNRTMLDGILKTAEMAASASAQLPSSLSQPAPEMQGLAKAFEGKWTITEKYEPDEWIPNGGVGYGEEVWRRGPGGFTFMEEVHDHGPTGESFGLAVLWWDKNKGFQSMWCENHNPQGCAIGRDVNGSFKWDGKQQVIDNEFQRNGKTFKWHEVFTDITPTSFVQTADIGEQGGPLKRWLTIHATRVTNSLSTPTTNAGKTVAPRPEIQKLADILAGAWSGTLTTEPSPSLPNGDTGHADEVWRILPGGMPVIEENHISTNSRESYDYAAIWWNGKTRKYQGIWCAEINDEGCNGFDAKVDGNQVVMNGEWEHQGTRRAWHEVFSRPTSTSSVQTLDIGEPGGELKRVSAIHAVKLLEEAVNSSDTPAAERELRAAMDERLKASLKGDSDKVASLLADEYLQTDISGHVQDKATWLKEYFNPIAELIRASKFSWEVYDQKELQFRIYGDSAVVVGALEAKGSGARWVPQSHTWEADPNASFSGTLRFTHVYIKRNGKWLLAALHNAVPFSPPSSK